MSAGAVARPGRANAARVAEGAARIQPMSRLFRIQVEMLVPAEPHAVRSARRTVESFAADRGFAPVKVADLSLAVAEALFNALEHGNRNSACVALGLHYHPGALEVVVEDQGDPAECEQRLAAMRRALAESDAPGPAPEADLERGRGLYLIRARADAVRVERISGGGVRIVMVKRR